jgi:hypothetical protein
MLDRVFGQRLFRCNEAELIEMEAAKAGDNPDHGIGRRWLLRDWFPGSAPQTYQHLKAPSDAHEQRQRPFQPLDRRACISSTSLPPADPPDLLDYPGAQLLLIGASPDVRGELGLELNPDRENERTAEIFRDLRLAKSQFKVEPLFKGNWA